MANQRRSVWEIRFYALLTLIQSKKDCAIDRIGHRHIKEIFDDSQDEADRRQYELFSDLSKKAREIETQKSRYLWVGDRD